METNIAVKEMPAMDLIYCRHVGQYDQIGGAYEKLLKWAGPRGLLKFLDTKTVTVYHDDPKVVDIDKVRQSACITVDEEAKPEGEFGKMHLPCGYLRSGETTVAHIKISKPICLKVPPKGTFPNFQTI
jgi:AraC family transcriptional regulator